MPRKPAHLEMAGGRGPRQRIWEVIRKQAQDFTGPGIERATRIDLATIRTYIQVLERGGFIEQINERTRFTERQHYQLLRDVGVEAPRLNRQGKVVPATGNENMWRTMRIMGEFTAAELAIRSSTADIRVAEQTAKAYLHALAVAGYLVIVEEGHPFVRGKGPRQTKYRLVARMYTGPRPPMIQRTKCVYDPNLAKVMWQEGPDHDAC